MTLETKTYITSNFRETNTKSREEFEIIVKSLYLPDSSKIALIFMSTNDIYNKIIEILSKTKLIDKIFMIREENTFCIWTSLRRYDKNARYALYAQELEIIKYFAPVEFHFDFHLAESDDTEELFASGARIIHPKT